MSVTGLDAEQLAQVQATEARAGALMVFAGAIGPGTPAMAGAYEVDAHGLHFTPLFRFGPGVRYTARVRIGALRLEREFEVAAEEARSPRVVAVHPSGETLPENALRLYVHFSQPMAWRDAQRHVRLLDAEGREVPLAFVEVEGGLWDPERRRLTLLFHPGRVKRGVAPGERMGPPLRAGGAYRLVVDAAMEDARGARLDRPFAHGFRAVQADREPPREGGLVLAAPARASDPVSLGLPEALDHALLRRWVWVEDASGERVAGEADVVDGETRVLFRPARAWTPGRYAVRVERALEDRSGNRFDRAFDREPGAAAPPAAEPIRLPFEVR